MLIIFLDTETTGFSKEDRVIELAIIRSYYDDNDKPVWRTEQSSLVNAGQPISEGASKANGLVDADLEHAPTPDQLVDVLRELGEADLVVAHNSKFDERMIEQTWGQYYYGRQRPLWWDTLPAARQLVPDAPDHKLPTLVTHLNLQADSGAHRALADAKAVEQLFLHLVKIHRSGTIKGMAR